MMSTALLDTETNRKFCLTDDLEIEVPLSAIMRSTSLLVIETNRKYCLTDDLENEVPLSAIMMSTSLLDTETSRKYCLTEHLENEVPLSAIIMSIQSGALKYKENTAKPVLSVHSKRTPTFFFNTNYRLMQVKSIAECSIGSILQYFQPSLSYHFPLRPLFCLFLSDHLRQISLYC